MKGALGYALVGVLVGIVPVALGLLWLPSLRRVSTRWLVAFMALTAGLLTFLGVEALSEALALQRALPSALGGAGLVLLGVATSWITLTIISHRFSRRGGGGGGALGGLSLATLVAIGIGLHNLGEGLAIGSSFALGRACTRLVSHHRLHDPQRHRGPRHRRADRGRCKSRGAGRLAGLAVVAGGPTILGAWLGGYLTNDLLGVLFFAVGAGAAFQVVTEVGRYVARKVDGRVDVPVGARRILRRDRRDVRHRRARRVAHHRGSPVSGAS